MSDDKPNVNDELNATDDDGVREDADTSGETQDEQKEADEAVLSDSELETEFKTEEPATAKPVSDDQRSVDREAAKVAYQLQLKAQSSKVMKRIDAGDTIEEALEGVPAHLKGKLRKIAEGDEILEEVPEKETPVPQKSAKEIYEELRDNEKYQEALPKLLEATGLNKKSSEAKAKRNALSSKFKTLVEKYGIPKYEALNLAAADLKLLTKDVEAKAFEKGLKFGAKALPKPGEPSRSPKTNVGGITEENIDKLSDKEFFDQMEKMSKLD